MDHCVERKKTTTLHGRIITTFTFAVLAISLILPLAGCREAVVSGAPEVALEPPIAAQRPFELTIHGQTRIDEYYWLREREDPEVIAYLEAENDYTAASLLHTKKLQESLFDEIVGRISKNDESVPYLRNGYYYYDRYEEGKEYPVYCRKKGSLEAIEEILLNVNEMAAGYDYYHVTGLAVSPDNAILAFGVDTVSRRKYTIYFKDLETGELLGDSIPITSGRAVWANDNRTVFYAVKDETLRPYMIMSHVLGTDVTSDREIYREEDPTFNAYVSRSKSDEYIYITSNSTVSTEYRYLDADDPVGQFKVLAPRERDHEYELYHQGDHFYIVTNRGAKNFKLMKTPVHTPSESGWEEVIPHRDDVLITGIELFDDYLVISERRNGLAEIRIIENGTGLEHYLDFGEEAYTASLKDNHVLDSSTLRFEYSSLTTPNSTFDYGMDTREKRLLKQTEVLGGFSPDDYESKRHYAEANDGTKIPISLVYRKGVERDGNNPLLLYGYGAYGFSMSASFRSYRLSLLDRGYIFAIAHVRGGQEMGRYWYEDGKLLKKKNTFTDFIDCAEYLIEEKFTSPASLFAMGGSAGGLLVGAVINMRPDLFRGVIAAVPWVDVVTTMLDESIPLTTAEYDEWGNPNKREYYDYMLSYSPYDNVTRQEYPAMLVTTGLHDSQVQYWEPAKWVARLRALKTDDEILLLHTNMEAGHSGKSGRFRRHRETALEFAFLLDLIGIRE